MPKTTGFGQLIAVWAVSCALCAATAPPICGAASRQAAPTPPTSEQASAPTAPPISAGTTQPSDAAGVADAAAAAIPPHLAQAEALLSELPNATLNVYGESRTSKDFIDWSPEHPAARTVCSTFAAFLIQHTYGLTNRQMIAWLHSETPDAYRFHNAIVARKGFIGFREVERIRPGDFLVAKYYAGSDDTGHVMLADSTATAMPAAPPMVPDTTQYTISVIDSSKSGHGPTDTRHRPGGGYSTGIGRGVFRLYADPAGRIVGYAWSVSPASKYYTRPDRDLIVGRLIRNTSAR